MDNPELIENLKAAVKEQNRIVTNLITHPPKPIPRDDLFTPFDTKPWKRNIAEIEDAFEKGLFKKFDEWKARITEEKILGKVGARFDGRAASQGPGRCSRFASQRGGIRGVQGSVQHPVRKRGLPEEAFRQLQREARRSC